MTFIIKQPFSLQSPDDGSDLLHFYYTLLHNFINVTLTLTFYVELTFNSQLLLEVIYLLAIS